MGFHHHVRDLLSISVTPDDVIGTVTDPSSGHSPVTPVRSFTNSASTFPKSTVEEVNPPFVSPVYEKKLDGTMSGKSQNWLSNISSPMIGSMSLDWYWQGVQS
jgi:hypothetical protein